MPHRASLSADPVAFEMQRIVRETIEPPRAGESVKEQINRAARVLDLSAKRAESFWYGRGRVLAFEADRLRQAYQANRAARRLRLLRELEQLDAEAARLDAVAGGRNATS